LPAAGRWVIVLDASGIWHLRVGITAYDAAYVA